MVQASKRTSGKPNHTSSGHAQPLQSMTGYANVRGKLPGGEFAIELRSVNSRYLDLQFRSHDDLRFVESLVREALGNRFQRGKIECRLSWNRTHQPNDEQALRPDGLHELRALQDRVLTVFPQAQPLNCAAILNWPGVLLAANVDPEALQQAIALALQQAIDELDQSRQREGERLAVILLDKLQAMQQVLIQLEPQLPTFIQQYEQKLLQRFVDMWQVSLGGLDSHLDPSPQIARIPNPQQTPEIMERIRQEVAMHGIRLDVQEEIDRLKAHFQEAERILRKGGAAGKRLDFLMQELNREANTLGSKAHAIEQTQASLDLKLLIEQMREQVQNVE